MAAMVGRCEAQLVAARQAIDETLALMRDFRSDPQGGLKQGGGPARGKARSASEGAGRSSSSSQAAAAPDSSPAPHPFLLYYSEHQGAFRIGNRRVSVTPTEKRILDLLWESAPRPISREWIANTLASRPGSVDTLISNLRKKLDLLSDGRSHIESVRGLGWVLRPELCSLPGDPLPTTFGPGQGETK